MKVVCPNCHSIYNVRDDAVPETGARARCPNCEFMIPLAREKAADLPLGEHDYGKTMVLFMPMEAQQEERYESVQAAIVGRRMEMPAGRTVSLSVIEGEEPGREYLVSKVRTVIGRSRADIVLNDPEVSRQHAAVELYGEKAVARDLGSTNGTFVNQLGVRLSFLSDGDELQVGNTRLRFTLR